MRIPAYPSPLPYSGLATPLDACQFRMGHTNVTSVSGAGSGKCGLVASRNAVGTIGNAEGHPARKIHRIANTHNL